MLHYDPMTANERAYLEGNGMLERALPLQHAAARPSPVASGAPAATQQQQTPAPLVVRRPKPPNAMPPPVVVPTTLVESIAAALGLTKEKLIQGVVRMAIAIGLTLMLFAGVSRALAETPVPHEVPAPAEAAYAAEPNVVTTSPSAVAAASVPHPARAKASQPKTGDKANPPVRRVQVDTKPPAPKPSTGARPEAKSQAAESTHSEAAEIVKQVFWNQFHAGPPAAPATAGPHAEGVDGKVNDFQSRT